MPEPFPPILSEHRRKYATVERERRFLLDAFPKDAGVFRVHHLSDRYIRNSKTRLRKMEGEGETVLKLTHKIPWEGDGWQRGFITTMYLDEAEFCTFSSLPADVLTKTRYSVPVFGIDVFEGQLQGLILAEAEFDAAVKANALSVPDFAIAEVTSDERFTGGRLARASRDELISWLAEYRIKI